MRRHHAHTIAGSILLLGAALQWSFAAMSHDVVMLFLMLGAIVYLLIGLRLMWRGERGTDE